MKLFHLCGSNGFVCSGNFQVAPHFVFHFNKMHKCKHTHTPLCDHHLDQDREHFHHPRKLPAPLPSVPSRHPSSAASTTLASASERCDCPRASGRKRRGLCSACLLTQQRVRARISACASFCGWRTLHCVNTLQLSIYLMVDIWSVSGLGLL